MAYNAILTPEGGFPPYGFEVVSGALPQGLNLNSAAIVGTPLLTGGRAFTLRVTDQLGSSVTRKFKITIYKPLGITTTRLVPGRVGRNYRAVVKVSGAKTPYTWSLVSGNLPTGLSLQSTGRITGVPTETGQFSLTFEVSDSLGGKAQKGFTLIINP
ncbi:MAG: putative Ig domain-containing protein [Deltaproteobacteria bacterium]|nr:putative Ig domain-containing protein [Deltaproteobacteria bacterium]